MIQTNIIDAALKTNADAIHPGYGFLSENSQFVQKLSKTNIKFIGPNIEAIRIMGDKIQSKNLAIKAKVNTIPGYNDVIKNHNHSLDIGKNRYELFHRFESGEYCVKRHFHLVHHSDKAH